MTNRKNKRPTKRFKPSFTYQNSVTGLGANNPAPTKEQREAKATKMAEWNPARAREYLTSFKEIILKAAAKEKMERESEAENKTKTITRKDIDEKDRAVPSGSYTPPTDDAKAQRTLIDYRGNMENAIRNGEYDSLVHEHGLTGMPSMSEINRALTPIVKSKISTTAVLDILKKKPPIANRKFGGNFAGQTPDWSQKNPTQERDVESWAEERSRRGENKAMGLDNGLDGSLKANKNNLLGAPKLQGLNKEGNGTGEGAGAGVATGSGGLAGGGTAHVSTNSGIFTTTYWGDRGKKKKKSDNDIATMSFNKRGTDTSSQSIVVEKGRQRLDKALAPIYNRNVKMRDGGEQIAPVDQKRPKVVERQVSHKGTKRANTWKNP